MNNYQVQRVAVLTILHLAFFGLQAKPAHELRGQYKDAGLNGIQDVHTGLIWARCSAGQHQIRKLCAGSARAMNWHDARDYCINLQPQKGHWRLPGLSELQSLIDTNRQNAPYINLDYFNIANRAEYWTNDSTIDQAGVFFYYINFFDGLVYSAMANKRMYTRCVTGKAL